MMMLSLSYILFLCGLAGVLVAAAPVPQGSSSSGASSTTSSGSGFTVVGDSFDWLGLAQSVHADGGRLGTGYGD